MNSNNNSFYSNSNSKSSIILSYIIHRNSCQWMWFMKSFDDWWVIHRLVIMNSRFMKSFDEWILIRINSMMTMNVNEYKFDRI